MEHIRTIWPKDYDGIIAHLNEWWGGRSMTGMLPRLFFTHFSDTSFIIEEDSVVKGFLIGFISPVHPETAYIHVAGVHPSSRGQGIGKRLYRCFFEKAKAMGATHVECVTSPFNKESIAFHTKVGGIIKAGNHMNEDGVSHHLHYDGPDEHRVLFSIQLR